MSQFFEDRAHGKLRGHKERAVSGQVRTAFINVWVASQIWLAKLFLFRHETMICRTVLQHTFTFISLNK